MHKELVLRQRSLLQEVEDTTEGMRPADTDGETLIETSLIKYYF